MTSAKRHFKKSKPRARPQTSVTTAQNRAAEEALSFRAAIESSPDLIHIIDPQTLRFLYANETACQRLGITREEYTRLHVSDVARIERAELERTYAKAIAKPGQSITDIFIGIGKNDERVWIESHTRAVRLGARWVIVTVSRDITERRLAERAAARRARMHALLGAANTVVLRSQSPAELYQGLCDVGVRDGGFLAFAVLLPSAGALQATAASGALVPKWRETSLPLADSCFISTAFRTGQPSVADAVDNGARPAAWRALATSTGVRAYAALPLIRGGRAVGVIFLTAADRYAFDPESLTLLRGLTENIPFALDNFEREAKRVQSEQELLRFRAVMDASPDLIFFVDPEAMRFIYANEANARLGGRTVEEYATLTPSEASGIPEAALRRLYQDVIDKGGEGVTQEMMYKAKNGLPGWFETHRRAVRWGDKWIIVTISREISARKIAEKSAMRLSRMYAALGSTNEAIMHATSAQELYQRVCDAAVDGGKFLLGAVLLPESDGDRMSVAAATGPGARKLRNTYISTDAALPEGQGLVGTAFQTRASSISNDFLKDERMRPWHAVAERVGIKAGAAVPLLHAERTIGVLLLYSGEKRAFDEQVVRLLERMADNIAFALDNFERESERRAAEEAVRQSDERFRALTELSSDWYWEQDSEMRFTRIESRREDIGASRQVLLGKRPWETGYLIEGGGGWDAHRADLAAHRAYRDLVLYCRLRDGTQRYLSVSGEPFFDTAGRFLGYRGVSREITEQKHAEQRIQYLATHDGLTGLPNRVMFAQLLNLAIESAKRYDRRFALLFLDLDRFKVINDTLGHEAGDKLLQEAGARLKHVLRASDVVARLGGDEFVVLAQEVTEVGEVTDVARRILAAIAEPIVLAGQECRVTASIGICMFPLDAEDEPSLMKNADMAMYLAKEEGKNNFQFYSNEIRTQSLERLMLETKLRTALERNELALHYQAKLDLKTNTITGVEALLRWNNPELGAVSPAQFIPIAEETGMIVPIGKWVLATACAQNVAWQQQGLPPVCMAVNLSARQFADESLRDDIAATLAQTGMDARQLELEITEGMVIHNPTRAMKVLGGIKALGVRLAIDDFGTGYSSLGQLKNFPIDTLKVDRSFIRDIPHDADDTAIAEAIIAMGKTLSLTVVAEGVETVEQAEFLRTHACDEMQGFFFSRPVAPAQFAELLRSYKSAPGQPPRQAACS